MKNAVCRRGLYLMVLALLLFIGPSLGQKHNSTPGAKSVRLAFTRALLKTVFKRIEEQGGPHFLGTYNRATRITIPLRETTIDAFLQQYLVPLGYTCRWTADGNIILYPPSAEWVMPAESQPSQPAPANKVVTGIITDEALLPLPGVHIRVQGGNWGTNTDTAGRFQLQVPRADATLEVQLMSYETRRVALNGQETIRIQMKPADKSLDEVVITGYSEGAKRFVVGAVTRVTLIPTEQAGSSNALTALQGKVPGLQIDQTSGMPGSAVTIQLRGRNSLMSIAMPLLVINGIPYAGSLPVANLGSSLSSQNVNGGISSFSLQMFGEIESITVLKDAEATAIYGSKGANGVIVIQTVRGKPGKLMLDATLLRGWGKVAHKYHLFDTGEYLDMREEAFRNDGLIPGKDPGINYAPDLTVWDRFKYTDWQKELMGRSAIITDGNLALSFGDERTWVRIGGNYYKETSVFRRDLRYDRAGVNFTLDHISKDTSFKVSTYGFYAADGVYSFNSSVKAVFTPPNAKASRDDHNNLYWEPGLNNPYADFLKRYSLAKRNYLISASMQWKPFEGLIVRTNLGISGLNTNENDKLPIASQNPFLSAGLTGSATIAGKDVLGYIAEPIIEYQPLYLRGLTLLAGASFQYTTTTNRIITAEGYTNDADLSKLDKATYLSVNFKKTSAYKYGALFAQLKYHWLDRYIVNASLRRDASSRFSPEKNSGYFWSLGSAWIFSEAALIKSGLPWLRFGKLRGSIGLTGSDLVEDNQYQAVWASNPTNNPYQGVQGLSPQAPYNPYFSWERCLKKEMALDLTFGEDLIQTSFSYFRNKSYNQILQTELPAQSGFSNMLRNSPAVILNTGVEMVLSANVVKSSTVRLSLAANITLPSNKVVAFEKLETSPYHGTLLLNAPVTVLNKLQSEGVDKTDGLYKMKDLDGVPGYNKDDYTKIGSLDPRLLAGFELSFSWKNMTLDMVWDIRKQMGLSYLYPMMLADQYPGGMSNQITDLRDRWRQPGDEGKKYQKLSSLPGGAVNGNKNLIINSDRSYANTSYAKLRELSLRYTLPKKLKSLLHCRDASVFFIGRNLFTISNYPAGDPEIANVLSLSTLRTVSFGIKVSL
ncbi:SusC/RagA family TonB-linked outer membrane protein [Chitinophaga filiformis]|uniref:SusC/RagA family TonB-linked outer membrane protein n=1 Tax=Chitinophaga filiformis TaxID=104663 RepID=A0ABY4I6V5_CHIFI|nr:SusC/RagA family TonB-linked outer membrane protein [Chitinophaga filiformis]UPK71810.1 SusC/RagA family TonB-linked outer membrane protein [Chitinophaga filiformis]